MERHRFDPLSFSFGVIYALIGIIFLIPSSPLDLVPLVRDSGRWLWPLVVLGLGAAILAPMLRRTDPDEELDPDA
jgi:hypothetical protein